MPNKVRVSQSSQQVKNYPVILQDDFSWKAHPFMFTLTIQKVTERSNETN